VSLSSALDVKEQVRQAVDIVELVSGYVQLRRQGRGFVGRCPWHDDTRPSLTVNPDRQSFKCWVCDVGGDVFSFLMKAENIEFREALEMLAERAGVSIAPIHQGSASQGSDPAAEKRALYGAMAWAEELFHRCLLESPEAEAARRYLSERGIDDTTIQKFRLGFAPNQWDWLSARANKTEWSPAILERLGLVRCRESGEGRYDWFRGRVMFPIRDARSRPIAFGGRILPELADDHAAKYINSPETPLFSKSRELYGLDVARDAIGKSGRVVVMEGYTDCLMAHQNGIENVVAVLGTALGERHLPVLQRYTDSITLVLDGDDAGRRRTNEIIDQLLALFVRQQIDLRILTLPRGIDPCDLIRSHGSDEFRRLLDSAVDALEHKLTTVTNGLDPRTDTHRAAQAVETVLGTLAKIRPEAGTASSAAVLREHQVLSRIARQFYLPEEQLRLRLVALRRQIRRPDPRQKDSAPFEERSTCRLADFPPWDRELLELVLLDVAHLRVLADATEPHQIQSEIARKIFATCCRLLDEDQTPDFGRLMLEFDEPEIKNLLVEIDEACAAKATADAQRRIQDLLAAARCRQEVTEGRADLAALQTGQLNENEETEVLAKAFSELKRRKTGSLPTEG
jgi:DNA primase